MQHLLTHTACGGAPFVRGISEMSGICFNYRKTYRKGGTDRFLGSWNKEPAVRFFIPLSPSAKKEGRQTCAVRAVEIETCREVRCVCLHLLSFTFLPPCRPRCHVIYCAIFPSACTWPTLVRLSFGFFLFFSRALSIFHGCSGSCRRVRFLLASIHTHTLLRYGLLFPPSLSCRCAPGSHMVFSSCHANGTCC